MIAFYLSALTVVAVLAGAGTRWVQYRRAGRVAADVTQAVQARLADEALGIDIDYWCARASVLLQLSAADQARYEQLRAVPTSPSLVRRYDGIATAALQHEYRKLPLAAQLDLLHGGDDPYAQAFWCAIERRLDRGDVTGDAVASAELWRNLPPGLVTTLTAPSMPRRRLWAAVNTTAASADLPATRA